MTSFPSSKSKPRMKDYIIRPDVLRKLETYVFLALDLVLLAIAYKVGIYLRFKTLSFEHLFAPHFYLVALLAVSSLYVFELYTSSRLKPAQLLAKIFAAIITAFTGISLVLYILGTDFFDGLFVGRGILALSFASFTVLSFFSRLHLSPVFRNLQGGLSCLLIGSDEEISRMKDAITEDSLGSVEVLSGEDYENIKQELHSYWSLTVVGDSVSKDERLKKDLISLRLAGKNLLLPFEFYEKYMQKIPVQLIDEDWTLRYGGFQLLNNPIGLRVKRFLDVVISIIVLILTIPFFVIIPLIMKIFEKGPIFYTQTRVGFKGRPFKIIKFRTMVQNAEQAGAQWAQANDARITRLGNFLRKTRIDELPQLFCVIKGDMSLIGPRPERPEFTQKLAEVIPFYDLRHLVQPGVSGWAQVLYPYGASVEDAIRKLEFDLYYVKNYSLYLDLVILVKTLKTVVAKAGR